MGLTKHRVSREESYIASKKIGISIQFQQQEDHRLVIAGPNLLPLQQAISQHLCDDPELPD